MAVRRAATTSGTNDGSFAPNLRAEVDLVDLTPATTPGGHLPDVGPTDDTYWGEGGCGAMALAFTELHPGLKIGVEWGTGHDEGLVWHAAAYDPDTGRSFDFNGTDDIELALGNFSGEVEMDVDPSRVAASMRLRWSKDEPWEDERVYEAATVIAEHWGTDDADASDEDDDVAEHDESGPHTQVA